MRRSLHLAAASIVLAQGAPALANEGGGAGGAAFVPMKEIVVPIVDGSRAYGRLRVTLVLVAKDATTIPAIEAAMPAMRETAVITAAEFARLYASPYAPVDAERLAHALSTALISHDQTHSVSKILLVGVFAEVR